VNRPIAIVGAPSSIGIRPDEDGGQRRLDLAPGVLRQSGVSELADRDLGDVIPPPYRDFQRVPGKPRNESGVADYSRALASKVADAAADGSFVLLLGGDCSIVLGALLGAQRAGKNHLGLVYVDAHGDFATPETSRSGSAASMCLALAAGVGDTPLARLAGNHPLVRQEDIVIVGRRDENDPDPWYGQDVITKSPMLDIPDAELRRIGPRATADRALERLTERHLDGFWIHVDADVVDPIEVPAVDSPEPNGLRGDDLARILLPLASHPQALGMELTIYDPALDDDRSSARHLASLLAEVLRGPGL
jgi:arginase